MGRRCRPAFRVCLAEISPDRRCGIQKRLEMEDAMVSARIKYRKIDSYKYQLMERYVHETQWAVPKTQETRGKWVVLSKTGRLTLKKGYAWDGPSGPTIDTKNFMRGSLVHDALYQLMRERVLDHRKNRKRADKLLRTNVREDRMSWFRAQWVYRGVRLFGGAAARPSDS